MPASKINNTVFRFICVGIFNTIIGCLIMFTLYNVFKMDYYFSSAANYITVSILSFFLNKYFTFQNHQPSLVQFFIFILNIFICYILAYALAKAAVFSLLRDTDDALRGNLSLAAGAVLFSALNYLGQKIIVFR